MRKIKKELPKAQKGFLGRRVLKLFGYSDEAIEAATKKQNQLNKKANKNTTTNKKKTNTKKTNTNKESFFDKKFTFSTPTVGQVLKSPYTIPKGAFNIARKNPLGTSALALF